MSRSGTKHFARHAADWILLILAALLFHVLLFVLFVPVMPQKKTHEKHSRFTLILKSDPVHQKSDPYKLHYWMYYMDPESLVKADPEKGFSRILNRQRVSLPSPHHCPHGLYGKADSLSDEAGSVPYGERDLGELTTWVTDPLTSLRKEAEPSVKEKEAAMRYPVWTDHTGKKFSGFFLEDFNAWKLFKLYAGRAQRSTQLLLETEKGKLPGVVIRRSCGVPELDQLAKRQLSARKENYDFSTGKEKKRFYYDVLWKQPPLSGEMKK